MGYVKHLRDIRSYYSGYSMNYESLLSYTYHLQSN